MCDTKGMACGNVGRIRRSTAGFYGRRSQFLYIQTCKQCSLLNAKQKTGFAFATKLQVGYNPSDVGSITSSGLVRGAILNAIGNDETFSVQSCPGHGFYAGHLSPNRQALVTKCVYGFVVVFEFDDCGSYLKKTRVDLPKYMLKPGFMQGMYEVDQDDIQEFLQREIGFRLGVAHLREFHFPEELVELYRLPKVYQEFLVDPNGPAFDDELRACLPGQIKAWLSAGRFVLVCGNDYWLNSAGEVTDS
jgi:hypothetical protein